jgi:predicted phosphoribosyltransferase
MQFADRIDAWRRLASALAGSIDPDDLVIGLPRGGVPVAAEVAAALGTALDVLIVRKVGVPDRPEVAMGAVGENEVEIVDHDVLRLAGVTRARFEAAATAERVEVVRRESVLRAGRPRHSLVGRTVVIVDDGMATGSTMQAACQVARALGAATIVVAVPVAPPEVVDEFRQVAESVVCLSSPWRFHSVGACYDDFSPTTEEDVIVLLAAADERCAAHEGPAPPG